MFEVYCNITGETFYVCNSRYALNQCMDYLEGLHHQVSYVPVTEGKDYSSYPRWVEV